MRGKALSEDSTVGAGGQRDGAEGGGRRDGGGARWDGANDEGPSGHSPTLAFPTHLPQLPPTPLTPPTLSKSQLRENKGTVPYGTYGTDHVQPYVPYETAV